MVPLQQIRRLSTIVFNKHQFFCKGIQRVFPKANFLPATWYLCKTLATSKVYFKNDKEKSKLLVNQNEAKANKKEKKIAEKKEPEEEDEILILVDPKTKRYRCTYEGCSKSYSNQSNLNHHIKKKHLKHKPHKCNYEGCSESFVYESGLKRHIEEKHTKPYKCDLCDMSFGRQDTLDQHIASQHAEDLKLVECPDCGETFKNPKELETHVKKFHVVTDHQCPHCKMYLSEPTALRRHIDKCLNIRNFICSKCGEAFVQKIALDNHMKYKHSNDRNYICDVEGCGKAFKSKSNLAQHKQTHSEERPHQCPYCEKAYKHFKDLLTHVDTKHSKEDDED